MAIASWTPSSVDSYANAGNYNTAWNSPTQVAPDPGRGGYLRRYLPGAAFDAVHDGCVVDSIKVELTASQSTAACDMSAYASFCGVNPSKRPLTTSSANYSATGGAGTLPATLRAATLESSCFNFDSFYNSSVSMSHPIVTVTYTDNGTTNTIFFGSNF